MTSMRWLEVAISIAALFSAHGQEVEVSERESHSHYFVHETHNTHVDLTFVNIDEGIGYGQTFLQCKNDDRLFQCRV